MDKNLKCEGSYYSEYVTRGTERAEILKTRETVSNLSSLTAQLWAFKQDFF